MRYENQFGDHGRFVITNGGPEVLQQALLYQREPWVAEVRLYNYQRIVHGKPVHTIK